MQMTRRDLAPREAMERWLDKLRLERSEQSISTYYYRLKLFVEWCEARGIDSLQELDGWLIEEYDAHRRSKDPTTNSLKNEFTTLKNWLEYCARLEVVDDGLAGKVEIPTVPKSEQSSGIKLSAEAAEALLSHYRETPEVYGTRNHVLLELTWHTGARVGGIRALDLDDQGTAPDGGRYLLFRNRPETGTRLKKGVDGERPVMVSPPVWDVVDEYVATHRIDATDEYGRAPLITSQLGRPGKGTLRQWMYQATIPCHHSPCPHDRERETCEYTDYNHSSKCPSSRSPHQVRTGAITWMRDQGISAERVAARVNASVDTIEEHYDKQDPVTEMLQRRAQTFEQLDITEDKTDDS